MHHQMVLLEPNHGSVCGDQVIGHHLILECRGALAHCDGDALTTILLQTAAAGGATVISSHFHAFDGGGYTGVVVLMESHITIHTWPELHYAAIDIFLCGRCNVEAAFEKLQQLSPRSIFTPTMINRMLPKGVL